MCQSISVKFENDVKYQMMWCSKKAIILLNCLLLLYFERYSFQTTNSILNVFIQLKIFENLMNERYEKANIVQNKVYF